MSENRKSNHETVDGDVDRMFVGKPYGRELTAIRMVVQNPRMKNPTRDSQYSSAR